MMHANIKEIDENASGVVHNIYPDSETKQESIV